MSHLRNALRACLLPLALLVPGCAREADRERPPAAAEAAPPPPTAEEMARPSPAAAAVAAFAAICGEPAPRPVARAAAARDFAPVPVAVLREETSGGAAFPRDAAVWRGPAEVGGAVLLWLPGTATCELRAQGVDTVVVEAEFAKLPQAFEEAGTSVMRLPPPIARAGVPRTRQMLLVSPDGGPERARVLRLADGGAAAKDAVVLSARGVAGPGAR